MRILVSPFTALRCCVGTKLIRLYTHTHTHTPEELIKQVIWDEKNQGSKDYYNKKRSHRKYAHFAIGTPWDLLASTITSSALVCLFSPWPLFPAVKEKLFYLETHCSLLLSQHYPRAQLFSNSRAPGWPQQPGTMPESTACRLGGVVTKVPKSLIYEEILGKWSMLWRHSVYECFSHSATIKGEQNSLLPLETNITKAAEEMVGPSPGSIHSAPPSVNPGPQLGNKFCSLQERSFSCTFFFFFCQLQMRKTHWFHLKD